MGFRRLSMIILIQILFYLTLALVASDPPIQNTTSLMEGSMECSTTLPLSPYYLTLHACARSYTPSLASSVKHYTNPIQKPFPSSTPSTK